MSSAKETKFYNVKDLINDQGDIAIIIEEHPDTPGQFVISTYQLLQSDSLMELDISNSYLSACDIPDSNFNFNQFKYLLVLDPPLSDLSFDSTPITHLPSVAAKANNCSVKVDFWSEIQCIAQSALHLMQGMVLTVSKRYSCSAVSLMYVLMGSE